MRCARCGNENPGTNRFCGMCGATLLPASSGANPTAPVASPLSSAPPSPPRPAAPTGVPVPAPPAVSTQNTTVTRPATARAVEPVASSTPSFLGLNDPAPAKRANLGSDSLSINPQNLEAKSTPSAGNLDYLLEDDDEPKSGGAGKAILIVVVVAIVVGIGYLRWKNQSFAFLTGGSSKPAAATQAADEPDANPATSANSNPAPADSSAQPAPAESSAASSNPGSTNPASANSPSTNPPNAAPSASDTPAPVTKRAVPPPVTRPTASLPKPKPVAADIPKPAATKAGEPVAEAQKYLYGKGVTQDCDRGLRLLKPAADRANPKAMIEMGALYSAGLCTPRDLPTAYRWFAQALRKDPDNAAVQTDLQKLWSEMTQPERQLAIKLSQ